MTDRDGTDYYRRNTVELRAAGIDPAAVAAGPIVTVAAPYTNAHRCNNRVRRIADLLTADAPSATR